MSSVPVSDLQAPNLEPIIELFELELNQTLHGASTVYRWHSGASSNDNADITFGGNAYLRLPIEADGFEYSAGQNSSLPRPTLRVSNLFGTVTSILLEVNETTVGNDLTGAKLTRIRTLARYIDAGNFGANNVLTTADDLELQLEDGEGIQVENIANPFGTPDSTQRFPDEIYYVDRKSIENRDVVEFELASVFDLAGVKLPKRQVLPSDFPGVGTFVA
tara:strand:- start:1862 stop:2518 length:657 start_codon:yes stop_codon:yes gene_type:complete